MKKFYDLNAGDEIAIIYLQENNSPPKFVYEMFGHLKIDTVNITKAEHHENETILSLSDGRTLQCDRTCWFMVGIYCVQCPNDIQIIKQIEDLVLAGVQMEKRKIYKRVQDLAKALGF